MIRGLTDKKRAKGAYRIVTRERYPFHRGQQYKPFFIIGSGRSGTTLLRRLLMSRGVHISPEVWCMSEIYSSFTRLSLLAQWEDLAHLVLSRMLVTSSCTNEFRSNAREIIRKAFKIPENQRSLAALINHFHMENARFVGANASLWGDKTPKNCFAMEEISKIFPDAQYIHLVRDGLDVVSSYYEAGLQTDLSQAAIRWVESIESVKSFEAKNAQSVLEVRYEQMVMNKDETLRDIHEFLGLRSNNISTKTIVPDDIKEAVHHRNVAKPVTSSYIGKGRKKLSHDQKLTIAPIADNMLIKMGYNKYLK